MSFTRKLLYTGAALTTGLYFLFLGLVEAKAFLAPLVTAIILALLMIPVSNKLESWGMSRGISSLISTIIIMIVSLAIASLVFFQIKSFVNDWETIEEAMEPKILQIERYFLEETDLEQEDIDSYKEKGNFSALVTSPNSGKTVFGVLGTVIGFITAILLMLVYIFFLLLYRKMFKKFILKLFSKEKESEVRCVIDQTAKISQHYLAGRLVLMVILAILYSLGLGISGLSNFILIGLIAAVLSLIPFLGNIIGLAIAMAFGFLTTGETSVLVGIILTFAVAQFIDSLILQPIILGNKVNIHPLFIILVLILGNMVWGVIGMALAIPILGIINIAFGYIKPLQPLSYLLSNPKEDRKK